MTTEATLQKQRDRVWLGIALLHAYTLGCHEAWRRTIAGRGFDGLLSTGLMERREFFVYDTNIYEFRLTPKGLAALAKLHDALTLGLE